MNSKPGKHNVAFWEKIQCKKKLSFKKILLKEFFDEIKYRGMCIFKAYNMCLNI